MKLRPHRIALVTLLFFACFPAHAQRLERDGLVYDNTAPIDAGATERFAVLDQARGMRLLDWMPDGTLLVALRSEDTEQLHRIRTPLGTPELLAPGTDRVVIASAQPFQSDALAVVRQMSGRDPALWRLSADGKESRLLLGPEWRAEHPLWAHDGQRLVVTSAMRGLQHDVFLLDTRTTEPPRALTSEGGDWQALDWSLDDRALLLAHRDALGAGELVWLDVASGERHTIVAAPSGQRPLDARIAPDGRGILYRGRADGDWLRLMYTSLDGKTSRPLTPLMKRNVEHYAVSPNGRFLAYSIDDNGWSRLSLLDQQASVERSVASLPAGVIDALQFDRSGARLAINSESSVSPPDVFVLDLASNALVRWTQASAGPAGAALFSNAQPVHYRGWNASGGSQSGALLFAPRGTTPLATRPQAPLPVVIYLAGEDTAPRPRFDPLLQALAGGFAVLVPELHAARVAGDHSDEVRDIGALLLWIVHQPGLDAGRIAIVGTGLRSAVALSALALFSDRVQRAAVVDGDAIGVPLLAIERPVLIARGFTTPALNPAAADQILWKLRAAHSNAGLLGVSVSVPPDEDHRRLALDAALLKFLQ